MKKSDAVPRYRPHTAHAVRCWRNIPMNAEPAMLLSTTEILIVSALLLATGLHLIIRGWRGKRLDNHPTCRKCRFDLAGLPINSDDAACPECGINLAQHPPRLGNRRRSPTRIAIGALLLIVLLTGTCLHLATLYGNFRPYQLMPTFMLLSHFDSEVRVGGAPGRYLQEIEYRRPNWKPGSHHEQRYLQIITRGPTIIIDTIRQHQQSSRIGSSLGSLRIDLYKVAELATGEFHAGNLTWSDFVTSIQRGQSFVVHVPDRIRLDDPIPIQSNFEYWTPQDRTSRSGLVDTCRVDVLQASIAGRRLPEVAGRSFLAIEMEWLVEGLMKIALVHPGIEPGIRESNHIGVYEMPPTPRELGLDVGEHELVLQMRLTPLQNSPLGYLLANTAPPNVPGNMPDIIHRQTIEVVDNTVQTVTLIPYVPQFSTNTPFSASRMARIMIDRARNEFTIQVSGSFESAVPTAPPTEALPMEVILRADGREILLAYSRYRFAHFSGLDRLELLSGGRYPLSMLPEDLKDPALIYRSSHDAAAAFGYDEALDIPDIEIPLDTVIKP